MTPLSASQIAAIDSLKASVNQLISAWPVSGSPGKVLASEIQANLVSFYEGILGVGQVKKS